ncbi:hypothetical protein WJX73_010831 [Symbiochloris irregularis]|uniref:Uncharacterized protein n=1 Tax=Symbiochloris irregularis TaxID=706552 RepID=A0AAW1NZ16_9CHLO
MAALLRDCCSNAELLISPQVLELWNSKAAAYGPVLSGALFGGGWWFWVDAVTCSQNKVSFLQYLPGIVATLALVMINSIRREELDDPYDAFDEGVFCRSRFWLLVSYMVSTGAVVGSILVLLHFYAWNSEVPSLWPGIAGIFQVILILGSALIFFVSRSGGGSDDYGGYSGF